MFVRADIRLKTIRGEALHDIVKVARKFELDFDDAYQYSAAAKEEMRLVSFDDDFDRTDRGRSTPRDILDSLQDK